MNLPTLLVVGPMKCGSTWIQNYLAARGDVGLPNIVKETFFFDRYFNRGANWYSRHFTTGSDKRFSQIVEVAPSLFHQANIPKRVKCTLGDVTIIVTTRNPVGRSWSHYVHLRRYGYTRKSIRAAISAFPAVIEASCFDAILPRWSNEFGKDRLFILSLEELKADPASYARKLCEILDLPYKPPDLSRASEYNAAAEAPSYLLAKAGRQLSYALRSAGLYRIVAGAKKAGFQPIFFGRPKADRSREMVPTQNDLEWLKKKIDSRSRELRGG